MSNLEEFVKITTAIKDAPIPLNEVQLQNIYLGFIAQYLAQIADALNEIKEQANGKKA